MGLDLIVTITLYGLGVTLLVLGVISFWREWRYTASTLLVLAFVSVFSSQSWVRGFLKTLTVDLIGTYGAKLDDFQTTIEKQSRKLSEQQDALASFQSEIQDAQVQLAKQQEQLSQTDRLLKQIVGAGRTEYFQLSKSDRIAIVSHKDRKHSVYLLLRAAPIRQSIEIQYYVYAQPPNSFFVIKNLILLRWGDSKSKLSAKQFSVRYVADPGVTEAFSTLTVTVDRASVDGEPVMWAFIELDPTVRERKPE